MLYQKSIANLEVAKLCLDKKEIFFSVGISRAYYAIFQAAKWLLKENFFDYDKFRKENPNPNLKDQIDYSHGSIRLALEDFLKKNGFNKNNDFIFIRKMSTAFQDLYGLRRLADYENDSIAKKDLEDSIKKAEMIIDKLKGYNG